MITPVEGRWPKKKGNRFQVLGVFYSDFFQRSFLEMCDEAENGWEETYALVI